MENLSNQREKSTEAMSALLAFPRSMALSSWFQRLIKRETIFSFVQEWQYQPVNQLDLTARLAFHQQSFSTDDMPQALRRLRQEHLALCLVRDVEHHAPLDEITKAMTRFAEFAINITLIQAKAELLPRYGVPLTEAGEEVDLHIIGMGKLGGYELNVSSDIDLIFLYPEEGETNGKKSISTDEYFTKMGKKIINALDNINAEGQVFRVDMRLRPHGDSGALVCSFDMLENYLIRDGREWERYAWIKGRILIGRHEKALLNLIQPFVFRKYLDFSAMESMFDLHRQIRQQLKSKAMVGNIKLGEGGIREIEFIAQLMQLMRGGRRVELQQKPTCVVLQALAANGFMTQDNADKLIAHYVFLRRLEHRLQYQEDQQTQTLPDNAEGLYQIAASMSMEVLAFKSKLHRIQKEVSEQFSAIFEKEESTIVPAKPTSTLSVFDLADSKNQSAETLNWHVCWPINLQENGTIIDDVRNRLSENRLNPQLADDLFAHARHAKIRRLHGADEADHAKLVHHILHSATLLNAKQTLTSDTFKDGDWLLRRALDMFAVLARRPSYLRLLAHSLPSLDRLSRFLAASNWGASFLGKHPFLLDDLLDPRLLKESFHRATFAQQMRAGLKETLDVGEKMNALREAHHSEVFRLLAQDLENMLSVEKLSDHLSELADEMLSITFEQCWKQLRDKHTDTPKVAIIAYGKLGSKEIGYSSDMDLVLIRDSSDEDGAVPYNKLALSLTHWLSTATEAGQLFETDYRLRPDGDAGQLVPTLAGFAKYQHHKAWLWEHQALTRARFCAGFADIGEKFETLRRDIICLPRDKNTLRQEILTMREKMRLAHPIKTDVFDLKQSAGGLIDIEFIVQWAVLGYSNQYPELSDNIGNIALLNRLSSLKLLPKTLALDAATAYREYRRAQHLQRLNAHQSKHSSPSSWLDMAKSTQALWQHVFK